MSNLFLSPLLSLLALIVTLGVLITVHEFGHFWVARRLGVKVLRFSVGFGRPLWLRRGRVDGTEFAIAAVPLGGYVRMLDEREGEVAAHERHRAFNRQPVGSRIAIVAAGPLFNFLFAILTYSLMYMVGVTGTRPLLDEPTPGSIAATGGFQKGDLITAVDGEPTPTLQAVSLTLLERSMDAELIQVQVRDAQDHWQTRTLDLRNAEGLAENTQLLSQLGLSLWPIPAVVGQVLEDSPAEHAGLQPGDRIIAVDEQRISDWSALVNYVQEHPEQPLSFEIKRGGRQQTLVITPEAVTTEQGTIGRIGVSGQVPEELTEKMQVLISYGPFKAFVEGSQKTWDMSLFTLRMLWRMLIGKASLENISGPITIAQYAGQSVSIGWLPFLSFLALVSISLGVLNLLPIPVLDGGHLLYYGVELVKGSPLSEFAQEAGQRLGILLLVMLMALALFNDLTRLLG